jgi:hypothetical protein
MIQSLGRTPSIAGTSPLISAFGTVRLLVFLVLLGANACSSRIGDPCESNSSCGLGRICDMSQPGGYCTQVACDRSDCPSESVCVDFGNLSYYCMQKCGPFAFCRDGYECILDYPRPDEEGSLYPPFCNQTTVPGGQDAVAGDDATPGPDAEGG